MFLNSKCTVKAIKTANAMAMGRSIYCNYRLTAARAPVSADPLSAAELLSPSGSSKTPKSDALCSSWLQLAALPSRCHLFVLLRVAVCSLFSCLLSYTRRGGSVISLLSVFRNIQQLPDVHF